MASVVAILERAFDEHKYNVFPSHLLADSAIAAFFAICFPSDFSIWKAKAEHVLLTATVSQHLD